ncbi:MAG: HAD hydrolase-like protein, partial [Fibrobacteres bacterium]|nr:HAD hydrolase-like protein [Fibrobacterota bacterium]
MNNDNMLFDLDGTIIDPIEGIGKSINFALTSMGYPPRPDSELGRYIGPPLDESFRLITGLNDSDLATQFVVKYRERFTEIGYSENVLYSGIVEVLKKINTMGVPMGLCTSKRLDYAQMILKMHGIYELFEFISAGDIGIKKWQQIEK